MRKGSLSNRVKLEKVQERLPEQSISDAMILQPNLHGRTESPRKPTSVQFKFLKDLSFLTDPTEPRMYTVEIPAQHQKKLSRQLKRYSVPVHLPLFALACALAVCGFIFLFVVLR